jgi:hypothetical protein
VAPLAGIAVVAHGGTAGAIVEGLVAVGVGAVLVAVWLRERQAGRASRDGARLRDDERKSS